MSAAATRRADGWLDDRPDPLWARADARGWTRHRVLGLEILVAANTPHLARLAALAFGPSLPGPAVDGRVSDPGDEMAHDDSGRDPRSPAPSARPPADLRFRLIEGPPAGGDGWPPDAPGAATGRPVLREDGPRFAASDGAGGLVVADLSDGTATAWVPEGAPADRVRRVLVESPVWRLATWRGRLAVHAAAIAVDGVAVLVRGVSGAGKSSIAIAADRAGHAVLSEEVAWLDPERWAVWPHARDAHLADEAALRRVLGAAFDGRSVSFRLDADSGKLAVPLLAPTTAGPMAIGPLVLLDRLDPPQTPAPPVGGASAAWTPLPQAAAREAIERDRIVGEHAQPAGRWEEVCARLCAGGAFALRGGDPRARAASLASIVAAWRRGRPDEGPGGSEAP